MSGVGVMEVTDANFDQEVLKSMISPSFRISAPTQPR